MENTLKAAVAPYTVSTISHAILKTLLYFDIFQYPLTLEEIFLFSSCEIESSEPLTHEIDELESSGLIYRFGQFYGLQNVEANSIRRVKGNKEAEKFVPLAKARARLISRFPFVRAVMASGSLSKGYMDEKSDLDFFVVTEPNRLWIARTLFILYRKIFVPRSRHKEFCTNYFITSDRLEIDEKNIFTATELVTLIPLVNHDLHAQLMRANSWIGEYFPNFRLNESPLSGSCTDTLKYFGEKIISLVFPNQADKFLMKFSLRRFTKKYSHKFSHSEFLLAFKSTNYVSKGHLGNHQSRVLALLQEKIKLFESRFSVAPTHA